MSSQTKKQKLLIILIASISFIIFLIWLFTFNLNKKNIRSNKPSPKLQQIQQELNKTLEAWDKSREVIGEQMEKLEKKEKE